MELLFLFFMQQLTQCKHSPERMELIMGELLFLFFSNQLCISFILVFWKIIIEWQMAMAAVARRRKLLNNEVIVYLADNSWEILDNSSSDVSDFSQDTNFIHLMYDG